MPLPRVKIVLAPGVASSDNLIEINGHDVTSAIAGVQVARISAEPLAHVTLHLMAEAELDLEGVDIQVVSPTSGSPAEGLAEFLGSIDPGELEQAALAAMNGLDGGPANVGEAFVAVLKEWAKD